jgi:hypothetical protein
MTFKNMHRLNAGMLIIIVFVTGNYINNFIIQKALARKML